MLEILRKKKGLILVHTGDGKGKTTAALGLAFRAIGSGWKVLMIQFIKGDWKYGELETAKRFGDQFQIHQMGEGFTWVVKSDERQKELARKAWDFGKSAMVSGEYQLIIFDEINYVLDYGFLPLEEVVETVRNKPENVHVLLTGGNAKAEIIEIADLVTEMKKIKHPFDQGIVAQKGIEF